MKASPLPLLKLAANKFLLICKEIAEEENKTVREVINSLEIYDDIKKILHERYDLYLFIKESEENHKKIFKGFL